MAATITATGTWTVLNFDATKTPPTGPNLPTVASFQGEPLKYVDLPELTQFIQAMATGYGIPFNAAKALFDLCWRSFLLRETPTVRTAVAGS